MGSVTKMVRDFKASDRNCRDAHVVEFRKSSEREALSRARKRAVKVDVAKETVVVPAVEDLDL